MKGLQHRGVAIVGLAVLWAVPSAGLDPTKCKAKINSKDGVVLVAARGVTGSLLWGQYAGKEIFPLFNNSLECVLPDPKKCELGAAGTPERLYPPLGCTIYLKDTGDSSTCSAYIKKCVPGRRPCPSDMVTVGHSGRVCIDRYEASVWDSPIGTTQYGASSDNYPCTDNGQNCTNIYARSVSGVTPSRYITWFQAQQACQNVGKRLPSNGEWQQAVAGTPGLLCVVSGVSPSATGTSEGAFLGCVSAAGAVDMVGNMLEWVADWVPLRTTCPSWGAFSDDQQCFAGADTAVNIGPGALLRGGGFTSGASAGPLSVSATVQPSISTSFYGFRCAR